MGKKKQGIEASELVDVMDVKRINSINDPNGISELADLFLKGEHVFISGIKNEKLIKELAIKIVNSNNKSNYKSIVSPSLGDAVAKELVSKNDPTKYNRIDNDVLLGAVAKELVSKNDPTKYNGIDNYDLLDTLAAELVSKNDPTKYNRIDNDVLLKKIASAIIHENNPKKYNGITNKKLIKALATKIVRSNNDLPNGITNQELIKEVEQEKAQKAQKALEQKQEKAKKALEQEKTKKEKTKEQKTVEKKKEEVKCSIRYAKGTITIITKDRTQLDALKKTCVGETQEVQHLQEGYSQYVINPKTKEKGTGAENANGAIVINFESIEAKMKFMEDFGIDAKQIISSPENNPSSLCFKATDEQLKGNILYLDTVDTQKQKESIARSGFANLSEGEQQILRDMVSTNDPAIKDVKLADNLSDIKKEETFAIKYNEDGSLTITPKDGQHLQALIETGVGNASEADGTYIIPKLDKNGKGPGVFVDEKGNINIRAEGIIEQMQLTECLGIDLDYLVIGGDNTNNIITFQNKFSKNLREQSPVTFKYHGAKEQEEEALEHYKEKKHLTSGELHCLQKAIYKETISRQDILLINQDFSSLLIAEADAIKETVGKEAVAKEIVGKEDVEETVRKETVGKETVGKETVLTSNDVPVIKELAEKFIKKLSETGLESGFEEITKDITKDNLSKLDDLTKEIAKQLLEQKDEELYKKAGASPEIAKEIAKQLLDKDNEELYKKAAASPKIAKEIAKQLLDKNDEELYKKAAASPEVATAIAKQLLDKDNVEDYKKAAASPKIAEAVVKKILAPEYKDRHEKISGIDEFQDALSLREKSRKRANDTKYQIKCKEGSLIITPEHYGQLCDLIETGLGKLSKDGKSYIIPKAKSKNSKGVLIVRDKKGNNKIQINSDSPDKNHQLINALGLVGDDIASSPKQNALIFSDKHRNVLNDGNEVTIKYMNKEQRDKDLLKKINDDDFSYISDGDKVLLTKLLSDEEGSLDIFFTKKPKNKSFMKPLVKDYKKRQERAEEIERKAEKKFESQKKKIILKLDDKRYTKNAKNQKKAKDYLIQKAQDKENATPLERARMEAKDIVAKIGRIMFNDQSRYRDNSTKAGVVYNSKKDIKSR